MEPVGPITVMPGAGFSASHVTVTPPAVLLGACDQGVMGLNSPTLMSIGVSGFVSLVDLNRQWSEIRS